MNGKRFLPVFSILLLFIYTLSSPVEAIQFVR